MNNEKIIYEDQFFYITNCCEFSNVPGLFIIYSKQNPWFSSKKAIQRLAIIEKTIRDELMNQGFELTGIYREEYDENKLKIFIIPYKVEILKQNNISPDLYQPFIIKYLKSFESNRENSVENINHKILKILRQGDRSNDNK